MKIVEHCKIFFRIKYTEALKCAYAECIVNKLANILSVHLKEPKESEENRKIGAVRGSSSDIGIIAHTEVKFFNIAKADNGKHNVNCATVIQITHGIKQRVDIVNIDFYAVKRPRQTYFVLNIYVLENICINVVKKHSCRLFG